MNAGNAKALRRAMRRVESFHKLCQRADVLRSRGRGRSRRPCATGSPLVKLCGALKHFLDCFP
jgi:hypothetical protein